MSEWGERKTGASKAEVESGHWIAVQKRIFTRWANAYLRMRKLKIKELTTDLQDGVILINLLEILSGEQMHCKWRKEPKMEIHKRENLKTAFEFMSKHGLRLTNIGSVDVWDGNEKIILGLMWTIIAKFQVDEISVEGVSGKDGLKLWCKRNTTGYEGVNIKNFHRSWKDGLAFCALIHKHRSDIIDFDSLSTESAAENLAAAFQLAEDYFGIDRILDVEDLLDVPKPDEKIVITYVAFCFKGYVDYLRRLGQAKSIGKAIDITKRHDQWIAEYTEGATALRDWVTSTSEFYASEDHGDTAVAVKATLDSFNQYKSETKPDWKAQLTALEGTFNTFMTSCRNNNRPMYTPEASLVLSQLQASWKALEEQENRYEAQVRAQYSAFLTVEHNLAKLKIKKAKFTKWMDEHLEVFSGEDFGTSLVTAETLVEAHQTYESQLEQMKTLLTQCQGWATSDGIEAHAEYAASQATIAEMEELLTKTSNAGEAYGANLELCREQFEKFEAMDKVATWMATQQEFFMAGAYGESLLETNSLLEQQSGWGVQLAAKKEVLDGITSEQEVILTRLGTEKENLEAIAEQGSTYELYLGMQKELYEKFDAMDKMVGWCDTQNALFATENYGEDIAGVQGLLNEFKGTFTVNLPSQKAVLDEMTSEQEAITTRLEEVRAHMQATEEAAENYRVELLLSEERFEKLPVLDRCQAWLEDQNTTFSAGDYGASISEVAGLLEAFNTYNSNLDAQQETLNSMESNQDVILSRVAELKESLAATKEAGEVYQNELLLSQERLEKLPAIERVVAWVDAQSAVFGSGQHGESLADVMDLLALHETFDANHPKQCAVIDDMETYQEVIQNKMDESRAKLAEVLTAGGVYHEQLLLSKERHEKIPLIDRIEAWFDRQHEVFSAADPGTTVAEVANLLADYKSTAATLDARRQALADITSEQQIILDRKAAVLEKADALSQAGVEYQTQLLLAQERLSLFAIIDRTEAWLRDQEAFFAKGEYGETLVAVATLLAAFETFEPTMASKKSGIEDMSSEQAAIIERRDACAEFCARVEATAEEYRIQLLLSQERLEKLPMLERVSAWLVTQNALFDKQEYGDTLVDVATLLYSFNESFVGAAPAKKELLASLESEQDVIVAKLEETRTSMAATEEAAEYYNNQLLLSQERLTKLPVLDAIVEWLAVQDAVFGGGDYGDTLVAVSTLLASKTTIMTNLAAKKGTVEEMETYQEAVQTRMDEVKAAISATETAADSYEAQLLLNQERLQKLPVLERVDAWLATQNELFAAGEYGDSVHACQTLLEAFHETFSRPLVFHKEDVSEMTTEQEAIQTRIDEVQANVAATEAAAAEYEANINNNMAYYQRLRDLSKEYNKAADEFRYAVEDLADDLAEPVSTASIQQLGTLVDQFNSEVKPQVDNLTEKYNSIDTIATELTEAGVEDAFSRHTLQSLYDLYMDVYSNMGSREEQLTTSLAAEQERDELRRAFAAAASAVVEYCATTSAKVGALSGTLEEQDAALSKLQQSHRDSDLLAAADERASSLQDAGVVDNPHTGETSFSLHAQWDALVEVFERADASLKGQLLAARDESITPEQYKEIKEVFEFFDVGKDNMLDREEFHNCCTGIGLILSSEEVTEKVNELDTTGDGLVNFDEFTKFMMERLVEPGHTIDDVKDSFVQLAEGEAAVPNKTLLRTFADEAHLEYLTANMTATTIPGVDGEEDAFEFNDFVDSLFSR